MASAWALASVCNRRNDLPNERRVVQLKHDDETQTDEQEAEVKEQHQAATASRVGAERVRRARRFDDDPSSFRRFRTKSGFFRKGSTSISSVRTVTAE